MEAAEDCCVKVAVHICPFIGVERLQGCKDCVTVVPGKPQVQIVTHSFTFDHVYGSGGSTSSVMFEECVAPLVDGLFQGYNATDLAYGQVNSNGSMKHFADDLSGPLSPMSVLAQKQLMYTAGIGYGSVRESAASLDQTRKMAPIEQLSMKKLAIVGQSRKLWRWTRSHQQWLLQLKWKWQKPWRLSEWIRHSDKTIVKAMPRLVQFILPNTMALRGIWK